MVAKDLVDSAHILTLPGTMFGPRRAEGGDGQAEATLRIAFANADAAGLAEVCDRLAATRALMRPGLVAGLVAWGPSA
jgi:aspartate/methionine/tyrosine aminotransferase